jgi:NTP pyrophosphatase (non-canonical NTP hydrolase)
MTYYLYHIFGKKIGVTCDLKDRLTRQQGYKMGEFEVLDSSEDIDYISEKELELQSVFGYKVDRQSYKELITKQSKQKSNQMEVNVTDQTTTFPYPVNKLKGNLMDNKGLVIETSFGKFLLNDELITWIMENVRVSMYNPSRSYVYNKAMSEAFKTSKTSKQSKTEEISIFDLIRQWADERGIYKNGDTRTQYLKLIEEAGELSRAILKEDSAEFVDAIGDMVVVLTNLAALEGIKIEDCIASAYDVIKSRKGKMVNGTFVKESPQTQNGIEVSKSKLLQTL